MYSCLGQQQQLEFPALKGAVSGGRTPLSGHSSHDSWHYLGPLGLLENFHFHFIFTEEFPAQTCPAVAQGCSQICKAETSHPSSRRSPASCAHPDSAQPPGQHAAFGPSASPGWHPQEQPWGPQRQVQVCVSGSDHGSLAGVRNSFICVARGFLRGTVPLFWRGCDAVKKCLFVEPGSILQLSNFGTLCCQAHWRVWYSMSQRHKPMPVNSQFSLRSMLASADKWLKVRLELAVGAEALLGFPPHAWPGWGLWV